MNMKKYQYFELILLVLIAAYFTMLMIIEPRKPFEAYVKEWVNK